MIKIITLINNDNYISKKQKEVIEMKNFTFKAWAQAQCLKQAAKSKINEFFHDEQGDAGPIIIGVIIIVIAVALAVIFRDQLASWLDSLFNAANDDIGEVMSKPGVNSYTASGH